MRWSDLAGAMTPAEAAMVVTGLGLHVIALHRIVDGGCGCGAACAAAGKHPRTRRWQLRPEPEDVLRSDTGYGVRTGEQRSGAHLVVVDCDGTDPPSDLPPTLTVATGRGWHLYFRSHVAARNAVRVRDGIDVRGSGGFVVGPWSHHATGRRYEVVAARAPAVLPDAWGSVVARLPPPPPSAPVAHRSSYIDRAVREESERVRLAAVGARNATLFSAAYSLSRLLDDAAVHAALASAAHASGLPTWEIRRTIDSALRRRRAS